MFPYVPLLQQSITLSLHMQLLIIPYLNLSGSSQHYVLNAQTLFVWSDKYNLCW